MKNILLAGLFGLLFSTLVQAQRAYTAGEIQSRREVTYGRFEMMMYSSDVSGTTSTFFMWKNGGNNNNSRWNELDIETFGKQGDMWQSNPIWQYSGTDQVVKRWEVNHEGLQIANAWVKFTMEWTPNYIAWFNNDIEVRRIVKGENVPAWHFRYNGGNSQDPVGYIADAMRMSFNHWATFPGDWLGPFNPADLPSFQFVDWFTYEPYNTQTGGFDAVDLRLDFNTYADVTNNFTVSTHTFTENQCQFSTQAVGVVNGYLWLGIFGAGNEKNPTGNEIPTAPGGGTGTTYTHTVPGKVEAEEFNIQVGLQTEPTEDIGGGDNLGFTDNGDWAEYTIDVANDGDYIIDFRVASLAGDASLSLSVDDEIILPILTIGTTDGWQLWETVSDTISLTKGEHTLRFDVTAAGFNLNWMDIQAIPVLPVIEFTNISNGEEFDQGTDLNINVAATHSSGIANVQLYINDELLRQENLAPFDWGLGVNDPQLNTLIPDTYTLKAIATSLSNEVAETSITIEIVLVTGSNNLKSKELSIFPNPVVNNLHLSHFSDWELYSSLGKLVSTGKSQLVDMQNHENGIYFLKVNSSNYKIIKQ